MNYKTVFEYIQTPVLLINSECEVFNANRYAIDEFKINKLPAKIDSCFTDNTTNRIIQFINEYEGSLVKNKRINYQDTTVIITAIEESGEKLFICNILNEISFHLEQQIIEEKDKNKLLEKKFSKKAELNELQSVFVSMAAHQFRTPLAGIISSVNLIIRYLAADQETWNRILNKNKIEEHFSKIKLSIKDLTDILNRFLSISKLEEGEIKHEPKNFILEDFINDFIKYSQSLLKPGQKLICNYENTNQCVYLDEELLKNCLLNIVSNAIKYSANQQNIYFSAIIENQNILISIKDEGIGIPKEEQKFLFRRFYRAKNAKTLTGTGLGLNIVKKYLDIMNGEISCISEKGKGARFTIKLKQICHE